ncbi:MAG: hypothetical protein ACM3NZ_02230 [Betaproteobacteria bacterium]|jgi:hypothetical protein
MIEIPDVLSRFADDLLARPSGPFAFRFVLQPIMATLLALRDGTKDARAGRTPYFATVVRDPDRRRELLAEGLKATARVGAIGLALDTVYQLVVLHRFYPGEALVMALVLGFFPYLLIRGPADRFARWWTAHKAPHRGSVMTAKRSLSKEGCHD